MFARLFGKAAWFTSKSTDQAETVSASSVPGRSFSNLSVSADPSLLRRRGAVRRAVNRIYELRQIAEWQEADHRSDAEVLSGGSSEPSELIRSPWKGGSSSTLQQIPGPPSTTSGIALNSVGDLNSDAYSQDDDGSPRLCVVDKPEAESAAPCRAFFPMKLDHEPARGFTEMVKGTGPRWSVDDLTYLPETLRHLLLSGHTACEIGMAMETILYRRDDFLMDGRITALIDARATYDEIGQTVLKYVKLHNDDVPLPRSQAKLGNIFMRPHPASLRPGQVVRRQPAPQDVADRAALRELRSRTQSDVPPHEVINGPKEPAKPSAAETVRWPFLGHNPPFEYEDPNYKTPVICSNPLKPRPTVRFLDDLRRLETWAKTGTCAAQQNLQSPDATQVKVHRITDADIWSVPKHIPDLEPHQAEFVGCSDIYGAASEMQVATEWYGVVHEDSHHAPSTPGSSRTLV